MTKKNAILIVVCVAIWLDIDATANTPPAVTAIKCKVTKEVIQFTFDVTDVEYDSVKVSIELYDGNHQIITPELVKGDIGMMMTCGGKKKATIRVPTGVTARKVTFFVEDNAKFSPTTLVAMLDSTKVRCCLNELNFERSINGDRKALERTKSRIDSAFQAYGLAVYRQPVPYGDYTGHNIVGSKNGMRAMDTFIVGAHFDTVEGSPGADDNASGVCGVLEVARILSQFSFRHSLHFIAFDLEEQESVGSIRFLQEADKKRIAGYYNLDMIGFTSSSDGSQVVPEVVDEVFTDISESVKKNSYRGDFLLLCSNLKSEFLLQTFSAAAQRYVSNLPIVAISIDENLDSDSVDIDVFKQSDHAAFWLNDVPALSIGDTAGFRNGNYHASTDIFSSINYQFLNNSIAATAAALAESAILFHGSSTSIDISETR